MDYKEQYKHPNWQKKRLEIMHRDNFICRNCGSQDDTLNVHHCYYIPDTKVWEYPDESLLTLCEYCHKEWHIIKFSINKYLSIPTQQLYDISEVIYLLIKLSDFRIRDIFTWIKKKYF